MKRKKAHTKAGNSLPALFILTALLLHLPAVGRSQIGGGPSPRIQMEIEYARALQNMGLPQFASIVLERIRGEAPEAATIIEVMELQGLIAQGQFDEVRRIISQKPNQDGQEVWAMKLALADGFYAWGRYADAQGIYESFFQRYPDGPPEAINSFYVESAYKYSQMLLLMGDDRAALRAFGYLTKAKLENHIRRQILSEKTELLLKVAEASPAAERPAYIARAEALINEVIWQQDVWFGKAIVNMAHIAMMQGDTEKAMQLIDDYRDTLLDIDDALKEQEEETGEPLSRLSPMAQCRYLIGTMLHDKALKLIEEGGDRNQIIFMLTGGESGGRRRQGALHHFANVFLRYPGTPWAADAGIRLEKVQTLLKDDFGADININIPPDQMAKVEQFQFQEARTLFNQNQFEQAIEAYYRVLNMFPDSETAAAAVSEMARSYIELNREEDVPFRDMVVRYLAERFSGNSNTRTRAGDELLRIAGLFAERNLHGPKDEAYELFFSYFREHPRAAATIYYFGEVKLSEENYQEALDFYQVVATNYPRQRISIDALNRMSFCYSRLGQTTNEIATLEKLIERLGERERPGHEYISARFRKISAMRSVADAQRRALREQAEEDAETDPAEAEAAAERQAIQDQVTEAQTQLETTTENLRRAVAAGRRFQQENNTERLNQLRPILTRLRQEQTEQQEALNNLQARLNDLQEQAPAAAIIPSDPYEPLIPLYDQLIAMLTADDAERKFATEPGDVKKNQTVLEGALFFRSASQAMLNKPDDELRRLRVDAIRTFMQLVQDFPDSQFAASALSQIGTLWTVLDQPERAEAALRELQEKYPDSTEARNSLFVLGSNLLALGRRERAVEVFREMFAGGGDFSSSQILSAGRELLAEREYGIALDAFNRVLAAEKDRGFVEPSLLGKGRSLIELGQPEEGVKALAELIEKFPTSTSLIDAAKYLSRGYAELGRNEPDSDKRIDIFNDAVRSMRTARRHARGLGGQAELDVEVGRLQEAKAHAEQQFGNKERAERFLREAVAAYQSLIMLADAREPEVRPHVEQAYYRCMPLLMEIERYDAVIEDADTFQREFPRSQYAAEIRRWRNQASVRITEPVPTPGATRDTGPAGDGDAQASAPAETADAQDSDEITEDTGEDE